MSTPPTTPVGRAVRPAVVGLRLTLGLHAAAALAQPILMGGYLDGDFDLLAAHALVGSLLPVTALLALAAAVAYALVGRGAWHPVPALATLFLLEGFQIGMGYARVLTLHLPLGVLIVACALALAGWSFTPRARRTRPLPAPRTATAADLATVAE
jgi:hypothetical protein